MRAADRLMLIVRCEPRADRRALFRLPNVPERRLMSRLALVFVTNSLDEFVIVRIAGSKDSLVNNRLD